MLIEQLSEQQNSIPYRPNIAKEIWVISAIILQQIIYRWARWKFYKFMEPCWNKLYRKGDSWCEELWITKYEFSNNLKKIAFKKGKTKNTVSEENALIVYYKDNKNVTRYELKRENVEDFLSKCNMSISLGSEETWFPKEVKKLDLLYYTENTTNNTTNKQETNALSTKDKCLKNKKETCEEKPKVQYKLELEDIIKRWNGKTLVSKNKIKNFRQLPKNRIINNNLLEIYKSKRKEYSKEDILIWIKNYLTEMVNRKQDEKWYYNHRRWIWEFLKHHNGLDKFINLN